MTDTASQVRIDTAAQQRQCRMVHDPNTTLQKVRQAAEVAVYACIEADRRPVMVEVIVHVAPLEAVSE